MNKNKKTKLIAITGYNCTGKKLFFDLLLKKGRGKKITPFLFYVLDSNQKDISVPENGFKIDRNSFSKKVLDGEITFINHYKNIVQGFAPKFLFNNSDKVYVGIFEYPLIELLKKEKNLDIIVIELKAPEKTRFLRYLYKLKDNNIYEIWDIFYKENLYKEKDPDLTYYFSFDIIKLKDIKKSVKLFLKQWAKENNNS